MEDLEQLRVFLARQQAQLDQLQQHVQQQQVHQAQARQASPVGQDLSELRSIVDTRVMEKIPILDGNEAHFAELRSRQRVGFWVCRSCRPTTKQPSTSLLSSLEVSPKNKAVYHFLVASCRGRAQVLVRGVPKHAGLVAWRQVVRLYEPQVGGRLNAMLVGVLTPVWRQGDSYQFEEDLTAWDTRITEYERDSGKTVDPEVRMAVITQHAPQSMRQVVLQAAAQAEECTRFFVRSSSLICGPTSVSHQMDMEDHNQWMRAQSVRARTARREMERKARRQERRRWEGRWQGRWQGWQEQ